MFLHDLLYQCQSYAGIAAVIMYCQRLKHQEYPVVVFRRDAGAIIGYREFIIFTLFLCGNCSVTLFVLAVLDAVADQVGEYLVKV